MQREGRKQAAAPFAAEGSGRGIHAKNRRAALISRKRGELPAPTKEPRTLVGGPTVSVLVPNCGLGDVADRLVEVRVIEDVERI